MKRLLPFIILLSLLLTGCGETAETVQTPEPTLEPQFVFTRDNYPAAAGSASLERLGSALAGVMLGESQSAVSGLGSFGSTGAAYRALADGGCSLVLGMDWPDAGSDVSTAAIARDALVFVVSGENPVDSLTSQQLRDIYSGAATNWSELGGNDAEITAYQHGAASGTQAALNTLCMQGTALAEAPKDYVPAQDGELEEETAGFDGSAGAIGCMTYYYAVVMGMADEYKLVSVDGVAASADTIASGEYPFILNYCASILTSAREGSPERLLWEWLQCDAGQSLVSWCGYVPARSEAAK